jgi:manganese efflux pump family protein
VCLLRLQVPRFDVSHRNFGPRLLHVDGCFRGVAQPRRGTARTATDRGREDRLVFGVVEAITPVIGWAAGIAASRFIESVDHWIAFVLLALVGGHMVWNAVHHRPNDDAPDKAKSRLTLVMTAIATSIDAMIVGVSLAFLEVNIVLVAAAIGLATFAMSTIGLLAGHKVGTGLGRRAEAIGGILLIGLGVTILYQHLSAA